MLDKNDFKQIKDIVLGSEERLNEKIESVDQKVNLLDKKIESVDQKVNLLDRKIVSIDQKVSILDKKIDLVDQEVNLLDNKIESVDQKVNLLDKKIDSVKNEIVDIINREVTDLAVINREVISKVDVIGELDKRITRIEVKFGLKPF